MKTIKAKVHMLPTEDASRIMMFGGTDLIYSSVNKKGSNRFHLYITTDEEIKEGDWRFDIEGSLNDDNEVEHIGKAKNGIFLDMHNGKRLRKIIATTDLLEIQTPGMMSLQGEWVPKIPQSFIEEYCKAGGIHEVLVEIERMSNKGEWKDVLLPSEWGDHNPTRSKLNPNNTIIIHPVEEKMYNLEEIGEILKDFQADLHKEHNIPTVNVGFRLRWIKGNL